MAVLGSLFLAVHLVLPQLAGLRSTAEALARAAWWLPLVVIVLEAVSYIAYGELSLALLRGQGEHASRGLVQRATVVGASLGRTLPGGSTTALAVLIRTLRRAGVDATSATIALGSSGAISSVTLALLVPVAALVAMAGGQAGGVTLGALATAGVIVLAVGTLPVAARSPEGLAGAVGQLVRRVVPRRWQGRLSPDRAQRAVAAALWDVRRLLGQPRLLRTALGLAALNWLLDAAVLAVVAMTIGAGTPLPSLLLVYILGQLTAAVPLTPGGVGVVEAAMTAAFVAAGAPAPDATATVLGWRLVSHWLPIGVGLALLPTVAGGRDAPPGPGRPVRPRGAPGG